MMNMFIIRSRDLRNLRIRSVLWLRFACDRRRFAWWLVLELLLSVRSQAGVIHVNGRRGGTEPGDGLSWATAFTNLTAGITAAVAGDEVWVAAGVYTEGTQLVKDAVALYGGFAGTEM